MATKRKLTRNNLPKKARVPVDPAVTKTTQVAIEAASAPSEGVVQDVPVPIVSGSFAIYNHNGGFHIVWRKKGEKQERHLDMPPMLFQMAATMTGKSVDELMGELAGMVAQESPEASQDVSVEQLDQVAA